MRAVDFTKSIRRNAKHGWRNHACKDFRAPDPPPEPALRVGRAQTMLWCALVGSSFVRGACRPTTAILVLVARGARRAQGEGRGGRNWRRTSPSPGASREREGPNGGGERSSVHLCASPPQPAFPRRRVGHASLATGTQDGVSVLGQCWCKSVTGQDLLGSHRAISVNCHVTPRYNPRLRPRPACRRVSWSGPGPGVQVGPREHNTLRDHYGAWYGRLRVVVALRSRPRGGRVMRGTTSGLAVRVGRGST